MLQNGYMNSCERFLLAIATIYMSSQDGTVMYGETESVFPVAA